MAWTDWQQPQPLDSHELVTPFDSLISPTVFVHLMGSAHLNTFKLQYPAQCPTDDDSDARR